MKIRVCMNIIKGAVRPSRTTPQGIQTAVRLLLLAACALAVAPAQLQAGDTNWNSPYMRPWGPQTPPPRGQPVPIVRRAPVEPPPQVISAPAPAPARPSCAEITTGLVRMAKKMPPQVTLGQEFMYELNPTAIGCAGNVVITDRIPPGATYVRSEPPATVEGDHLVWRLEDLNPGETRPIKVWLRADKEGRLGSCATVSAEPRACAETMVGKPQLAIAKTGPETAQLGGEITYGVVVRNTGSAVAQGVVVTDTVPEGLSHSSGQRELSFNVGDLGPNQSKSIPVVLRADKRGKFCNAAVAVSSNAGKVDAQACTTVVQAGVKIVKNTEDKQLLINRAASYAIVVSNTGDVPLTGVVVTDTAAPETAIVAADGSTSSGNTATWNVGQLNPGQQKELAVKVLSKVPGRFCDTATVATAQGLKESAQACTEWVGVTGVLVEVVDDPDPIQVGETTTFTIRVTNQGSTRDIEELSIKSVFAAEIDPTTASSGGTVNGKTVTWPPVARLAPKQSVTYTILGKAVKAGDHRMETQVTTRLRPNPIVELESTTVY
jgi:uncharacterized repeat protein (TIGR01451 family)